VPLNLSRAPRVSYMASYQAPLTSELMAVALRAGDNHS